MEQAPPPWNGEPVIISPVYPGRDDAFIEPFVTLYAVAFASAPYHRTDSQVDGFRDALRRQLHYPGFTAFRAHVGTRTLGFGYGYTTMPNHTWHRNVGNALGARLRTWLTSCFALAELAVHPDAQGYGIGRALHDALLSAQAHPRALLSTLDTPSPARVMYASAGWRLLADNVRFPTSVDRYAIMGKVIGEH
ncbi:MAG TPA: GNAT family N-acetyltransferase [Acidimicrobiia bacterium]|jgi:GNAT superfamily N-acetyltransferase|nr:GNAT family N-acetyltransferase [Acidimicrobiia bacterium]